MSRRDVRIDRRRAQLVVSQQRLDRANVLVGFQQVSGKGVPQRVRMNRFRDAGTVCGLLTSSENGFAGDGPTGLAARKKPLLGALPTEVDPQ